MPADFDAVELTKEEKEVAIFDARCEKYWSQKKVSDQQKYLLEKEVMKTPFTAKELQNFVLEQNPWFKVDEQAKDIFRLLCLYFSNDKQFEVEGYSLKKGICICGDIVNELPLAQPTVSQHLKELKTAGLIKESIDGNSICYCIDEKALTKLQHYFANLSSKLEKKDSNCC